MIIPADRVGPVIIAKRRSRSPGVSTSYRTRSKSLGAITSARPRNRSTTEGRVKYGITAATVVEWPSDRALASGLGR